jgi:hypothetical protein
VLRREEHLSPEEIVALRDGAFDDPAVEMHVRECGLCLARLAEARLMRHAFRSSHTRPVGEHLSNKDVGQYFDAVYLGERMPTTRMHEIASHLDSCTFCYRRLLDLRGELTPSASLREQLFDRFEQLGREVQEGRYKLLISQLTDRLVMTLLGRPEERPVASMVSEYADIGRLSNRAPDRVGRLEGWTDEVNKILPEMNKARAHRAPLSESRQVPQQPEPLRARERLSHANANIDLQCVVEGQQRSLTITLTDRTSGGAVSGIVVSLVTVPDSLQEVITDATGNAAFALPEGKSTLTVGTTPPLEIELDFQPRDLP